MKSLLWFLLGFFIVFAFGINAHAAWPGQCQKIFYKIDHSAMASRANTQISYSSDTGIVSLPDFPWLAQDSMVDFLIVEVFYYENGSWNWYKTFYPQFLQANTLTLISSINANLVTDFLPATLLAAFANCNVSCLDSDNDGVCDMCDDEPHNSAIAGDNYLKGRYFYENKVVAITTTGGAAAESNYEKITFYDRTFPGYILGLGMPEGIDEETFVKAGGKFVALDKPELMYTKSCTTVANLDQCENVPCNYDQHLPESAGGDPSESDVVTVIPPASQKDDLGLYNPDVECDRRKYQCQNMCGGTEKVGGFGCEESGAYDCKCKEDGEIALYENYQDQSVNTEVIENTGDALAGAADGSSTGNAGGVAGHFGTVSDTDGDGTADSYQASGVTELDFSPLVQAAQGFRTKFPFSLIGSLGDLVDYIAADPVAPVFKPVFFGYECTIDLTLFDGIAAFLRGLFSLLLTVVSIWGLLALVS